MYKIALSDINKLFAAFAKENAVYAPVKDGSLTNYKFWDESKEVCLTNLNTTKSPKDIFFPQSENLVAFKRGEKTIDIIENRDPSEPTVLFGVRACDLKGMEVLDKVFLADPVDTYYAERRSKVAVVALACREPEETCFCGVFGIDPTNPAADATAWIVGDELYIKPVTEKGEKIIALANDVLSDADEAAVSKQQREVKEIMDKLPLAGLNLEGFDGDHMMEKFNSEKWKELSASCLGCGTCTFVCPTCQCYDIRDYDTGHGIKRFRCWDSCMYSDFTKMAHGNPRTSQVERFRQRFMHKLVYFPANNDGMYSCVGCGRCVQKCPVSMNIVKVIKALGVNE